MFYIIFIYTFVKTLKLKIMNFKINTWGIGSIMCAVGITLILLDHVGTYPSNCNEPHSVMDSIKLEFIFLFIWLFGRYSKFKEL